MMLLMKIELLSHIDVLRSKNYSNIVIQFADGFAANKCNVEVIVPYIYRRDNIKVRDIFSYYGLKYKFKVRFLKTLLFRNSPKHLYTLFLLFANALRCFLLFIKYLLRLNRSERIIIATANDILIPYIIFIKLLNANKIKIVPWEHEFHKRRRDFWVYQNSHGIITTNSVIKNEIVNQVGFSANKIILSYNPVSTARLSDRYDKTELRKKLGLNSNSPLVVYTGKLGIGIKENEYILASAELLPDYTFILTGGMPKVVRYYQNLLNKKGIKNVILTGFLHKYDDIKYYQYIADVLISYYSKYDINVKYNLPAKICEYMCTKNPIVTCDYPATRDLLNENNALFVEPENPKALAEGIKRLMEDKELASRLAQNAYETVKEITFEKIAKKIIDFVKIL